MYKKKNLKQYTDEVRVIKIQRLRALKDVWR